MDASSSTFLLTQDELKEFPLGVGTFLEQEGIFMVHIPSLWTALYKDNPDNWPEFRMPILLEKGRSYIPVDKAQLSRVAFLDGEGVTYLHGRGMVQGLEPKMYFPRKYRFVMTERPDNYERTYVPHASDCHECKAVRSWTANY